MIKIWLFLIAWPCIFFQQGAFLWTLLFGIMNNVRETSKQQAKTIANKFEMLREQGTVVLHKDKRDMQQREDLKVLTFGFLLQWCI